MQHRNELLRLLSALADEQLSESEQSRLEELLADEEGRRVYFQYMDTHARLMHHPAAGGERTLRGVDSLASVIGTDLSPAATVSPASRASEVRSSGRAKRAAAWKWLSYAGVAAATLAATLLIQLAMPRAATQQSAQSPAAGPPKYLATLSQAVDVTWGPATPAYHTGARVVSGDFELQRGMARLSYDEGVELIVEGPARLVLESQSAALLLEGKIVFHGDDASPPFSLSTPNSVLVDLGTEYAVEVRPTREEVHVFAGEVQRLSKLSSQVAPPEVLAAGEARRYELDAGSGRPTDAEPKKFVRELPSVSSRDTDPRAGLLAYEGFDYADDGALREETAGGGIGFSGTWGGGFARAVGEKNDDQMALNVSASLHRDDAASDSVGGSFEHVGFAKYFRRLAHPLRMDADAVYYVSFLFRREGPPLDPLNDVSIQLRESEELASEQRGDAIDLRKRLNFGVDRTNELFTHLERVGRRMPLPLSYGETYLLAVKVVASSIYPDQVFLRVYGPQEPIDRDEPSTWSAIGPPIQSDLIFEWLEIHINSGTRQAIDEIRLGTSWAAVAAPWTKN